MNTCTLIGTLTRPPHMAVKPDSGVHVVSLSLALEEPGKDGQRFTTYVTVDCYGQSAAMAEGLAQGTLVAVEGKLSWKPFELQGRETQHDGRHGETGQQAGAP